MTIDLSSLKKKAVTFGMIKEYGRSNEYDIMLVSRYISRKQPIQFKFNNIQLSMEVKGLAKGACS